mgnify:FL=1
MTQTKQKNPIRVLATVKWSAALFCATTINVGQVSASQSADIEVSATINVPIEVQCNTNMQFGTLSILWTSNLGDGTLKYEPAAVQAVELKDGGSGIAGNFTQSGGSLGECVVSNISGDFTVNTGSQIPLQNSNGDDILTFQAVVQGSDGSTPSSSELFEYTQMFPNSGTFDYENFGTVDVNNKTVTMKVGGHLFFPSGEITTDDISGTHTGRVTVQIEL